MSTGRPGPISRERPDTKRQPGLFDERGSTDVGQPPERPARSAAPPPSSLTDDDLIERLADAGPPDVDALCAQIVARALSAAVPALEVLWRRFHGSGIERPLREQRAVLATLARMNGLGARGGLPTICKEGSRTHEYACCVG